MEGRRWRGHAHEPQHCATTLQCEELAERPLSVSQLKCVSVLHFFIPARGLNYISGEMEAWEIKNRQNYSLMLQETYRTE